MPAGRPLKFQSVEELDSVILEYFEKCEKTNKPLTLAGLANAIDVDRKTLLNYSHNEEYFPSIKKAKSLCEQYAEEMLFQGRNVDRSLSSNPRCPRCGGLSRKANKYKNGQMYKCKGECKRGFSDRCPKKQNPPCRNAAGAARKGVLSSMADLKVENKYEKCAMEVYRVTSI